jgi:predicted dehydrogenase
MAYEGLRVAVVGAGRHAQTTIYPAMTAAGYDIRAVATRHLETASATARRFGGGRPFDDLGKMLAQIGTDIEALVLVLPADGYEQTLLQCLFTGLPVYCEKPVALDALTLRRIEDVRIKSGATIMVGYMKRFAPAYERVHALAQDPSFGGATAYNAYWGMGPGFGTLDYLMRENATHHLDLARFLMGEVTELAAWTYEPVEQSISAAILMKFASGAVGTLQVNNNSAWDHNNEWISVTGRGPVVVVDNVDTCIYRVPGESERRWSPNYTVPVPGSSSLTVTGFTGALTHFAEVARRGIPCRSDLASALRTTELAERVLTVVSQRAR